MSDDMAENTNLLLPSRAMSKRAFLFIGNAWRLSLADEYLPHDVAIEHFVAKTRLKRTVFFLLKK